MKRVWPFVVAGLGVCLLLAALVSPFASSAPDGLERVAQDHGFLSRTEGRQAWKAAPAGDYAVPGVRSAGLSTALAGVAGTLIVFGLAVGLGKVISGRRKNGDSSPGRSNGSPERDPAAG